MKKSNLILFSIFFMFFIFLSHDAYAVEVSSFKEFGNAINAEGNEIEISLNADFEFDSKISIQDKKVTIEGNGHTISRNSNYLEGLFTISEGATLTLNNLIIDGKSSDWKLDFDNQAYAGRYMRVPVILGENIISATESMIVNNGTLNMLKCEVKNNVSTVKNGGIINNGKDVYIEGSEFSNNYLNNKSTKGTVIYSTANTNVVVNNSKFINNVSGNNKSSAYAAGISISNGNLLKVYNNCIFENNFAQGNGSCFFIVGTTFEIKDSKFIKNGVGNDSGVCYIEVNENLKDKRVLFENNVFDGSYGLSLTGQSMASVIGTQSDEDIKLDIDINNCEFLNNIAATGVISNHGGYSRNIYINVDNCNFHDNMNTVFNSQECTYTIKNSIIKNNGTTSNRPSVAWVYSNQAKIIFENTIITENVSEAEGGCTIKLRGCEENMEIASTLILKKGTQIYNNKGYKGGGVYIHFYEDTSIARFIMEDGVVLCNNDAIVAGDDIFVDCPDKDYSNLDLILLDAKNMKVNGIDDWYYDYEDARFDTSEVVTVYDNTKDREVLALKAAGVFELEYNTNSGNNLTNTSNLILKTNQEKNITEEIPVKEGYEFLSWNTKIDGTGQTVMPGELYNGADGYILYAQYKKIEDSNGQNNGNDEIQKVKVDDTNKNNNNLVVILGMFFIIIGVNVIIFRKKVHKKSKRQLDI